MRNFDEKQNTTGGKPAETKPARVGAAGWLAITVLLGLLAISIWFAIDIWRSLEGTEISLHGKIAMALGIVVTLLLGAGLMALVFWSNRKGFDR